MQLPLCICPSLGTFRPSKAFGLMCVSPPLALFSGYICSAKLVPVSQYLGTVLVCLLGVACLRGEVLAFSLAGEHDWCCRLNQHEATTIHQKSVSLRMSVGLLFSWRLRKMEKFRVPSVHQHSRWNKEESHTRKQGMATRHYIFNRS